MFVAEENNFIISCRNHWKEVPDGIIKDFFPYKILEEKKTADRDTLVVMYILLSLRFKC